MRIRKKQDVVGAVGTMATEYTESSNAYYNAPYINEAVKDVYSTDEKVIGKWVNNKPLYRKVIYISSFPNQTTGNYAHNINNLDFVVSLSGVLKDNENFWTLPMTRISYTNYQVELRCTSTNVIITTNVNRSANTGYIIMEYTKTTD